MPVTITQSNTQAAVQEAGNGSINIKSAFFQSIKQWAKNVAIV